MVETTQKAVTEADAQRALDDLRNTLRGDGRVTLENVGQIKKDLKTMVDFKASNPGRARQMVKDANISEQERNDIDAKLCLDGDVEKKPHHRSPPSRDTDIFVQFLKMFVELLTGHSILDLDPPHIADAAAGAEMQPTQGGKDASIRLYLDAEMKGRDALSEEDRKTLLKGIDQRGYDPEKSSHMTWLLRNTLAKGGTDCGRKMRNLLQACQEVDNCVRNGEIPPAETAMAGSGGRYTTLDAMERAGGVTLGSAPALPTLTPRGHTR